MTTECDNTEQCTCPTHERLRALCIPAEEWAEWIALAREHGYLGEAA